MSFEATTAERRAHAHAVSGAIIAKLQRIRALWMDGKTDAEIAVEIEWSRKTVKRYRQVMQLIDPDRPAWRKRKSTASGRWSTL